MSKNGEVSDDPYLPAPAPADPVAGWPAGEAPAQPSTGYPPAQPSPAPSTEGKAVAALVCAILSWFVLPVVGAIVALVLARAAERAIDGRPAELTGQGLVSGARWVAWIHLVAVAMVVAFVSAFTIALAVGR